MRIAERPETDTMNIVLRFPHGEDVVIRAISVPTERLLALADEGYPLRFEPAFPASSFIVDMPSPTVR